MPIRDIRCNACGREAEVILIASGESPSCPDCGSSDVTVVMSATSSRTGHAAQGLPGPADTGCCGSRPGTGGCAGPGSCCGRGPGS